jgi:hypothetical protein
MYLPPRQLQALSTEAFLERFAQIGTVEALFAALRRSREVRSLQAAMREELIGAEEVDRFVRSLMQGFAPGEQFAFQLSLAAIAVACVGIGKSFAREFISHLANLDAVELSLAIQVAQQCALFVSGTIRETISGGGVIDEVRLVERIPRSDTRQTIGDFGGELVDA